MKPPFVPGVVRAFAAGAVLLHASVGCAQQPPGTGGRPVTPPTPASVSPDTTGTGILPVGFGSLRQDAIAIPLQLPGVMVKLTPLEENVILTLSPDSYRALRDLAESKRGAIARLVSQHGLLRGSLWHVSFYGLAPDARFSPLELTITVGGRDFRPVEILPLSTGFGEQRLQTRETQTALYLFDDALDVNQPLIVSLGSDRNESWAAKLKVIEQERVLIRSRAQGAAR